MTSVQVLGELKSRGVPGQSETKMHNKKEFFWCEKCKRWTPSHGTATHRGFSLKDKRPTDTSLAANLSCYGSIYLVAV